MDLDSSQPKEEEEEKNEIFLANIPQSYGTFSDSCTIKWPLMHSSIFWSYILHILLPYIYHNIDNLMKCNIKFNVKQSLLEYIFLQYFAAIYNFIKEI